MTQQNKVQRQTTEWSRIFTTHIIDLNPHVCLFIYVLNARGTLVGYSPWGCKRVEPDLVTEQQQMD